MELLTEKSAFALGNEIDGMTLMPFFEDTLDSLADCSPASEAMSTFEISPLYQWMAEYWN